MSLSQDVRYAGRLLLKDRWFTITAILILALGIGANNAVFTMVNGVLLRNVPFPDPEQLVFVETRDTRGRERGVSIADFDDWQAATRTLSDISIVFPGPAVLTEGEQFAEQYPGAWVSSSFFRMIGQGPVVGRDFRADDDLPGTPAAIVIANSVWQQRYGGDPSAIGRVVRMNGVTGTIVGVMPEGMRFPDEAQIWIAASQMPAPLRRAPRQARNYYAIGRVADGVTREQAQSELDTIGATLARQYPESNADLRPYITPYSERVIGPSIRMLFWSLMGAVAFVLLIACANVANLLLARSSRRTHEIGVRTALGASRLGIVRQLLIESVMLAFIAGVFGLVVSIGAIRWFEAELQNAGRPSWMTFTMDWHTFLFFLGACLATGLIFGMAPALQVSKTDVYETLKEGGRGGSGGVRARRWTSGLVVAELALTLVLLAGAALMMRSFLTIHGIDIGVDTSRLITSTMLLPARSYPTIEQRAAFLQRVEDSLGAVTAVESGTTASNAPFVGSAAREVEVEGEPLDSQRLATSLVSVGPRYFETVGVRPVRGRLLTRADEQAGEANVVINERFAEMYFGGQNPLNRRIRLVEGTDPAPWFTVIGVVPNIRQRMRAQEIEPDPVAYVSHVHNPGMARQTTVLVRARRNQAEAVQAVRETIRTIDPTIAVFGAAPLDDVLARQRWVQRVFGMTFTSFAVLALMLAAAGLYGVTAYAVTQRTREIGMRMVLGARPRQVIWLFLRRASVQIAVGSALGLALALASGRLLESFLVQVSPRDPVTLASIVVLLAGVAAAASFWPALRTTRYDPLVALRHE
jgi:putative ABC transport system permease protein